MCLTIYAKRIGEILECLLILEIGGFILIEATNQLQRAKQTNAHLGAAMSTNCLAMHIKNHHPELYKQREDYLEKKKRKHTKQDNPLKRAFEKTSAVLDENGNEKANESGQGPILQALNVVKKSVWDVGGSSALAANKSLMEMLSTAILPFSFVDNPGFARFCQCLQPRFKLPGRMHFSRYELPEVYDKLKSRIMQDLRLIDFLSFTTDGWTASDGKHSLISLTVHYLDENFCQQFRVIGAKPIKGRHSADVLVSLIKDTLASFEIGNEKVFMITRDSENLMKRVTNDIGFKSQNCFAHTLQLVRACFSINSLFLLKFINALDDEISLDNLLERIKKFVRKIRKSRVLGAELSEIQTALDLPENVLTKNVEVRWNSCYSMLDRFLSNRRAINLLSAGQNDLPAFTLDDWLAMGSMKAIMQPIFDATMLLERRDATIAVILPLYKAIIYALKRDGDGRFGLARDRIIEKLESKMAGIEDNRVLVLATMLDPRFKMIYLDSIRTEEFKQWLIHEAEKSQTSQEEIDTVLMELDANSTGSADDMFASFEKNQKNEMVFQVPAPSQNVLESRQRAELEVVDYLRDPKIKRSSDPSAYWKVNEQKWPLLARLVRKFHCAPATSSESERLFSPAGLIVTDLRKKLLPENLEKLLFCHHNILLYNFAYDLK